MTMRQITLAEYEAIHPDFRGIWTTERDDWPGWPEIRHQYIGKRTMMAGDGKCTLLVEGLGFEVIEPEKYPQGSAACPACGSVWLDSDHAASCCPESRYAE